MRSSMIALISPLIWFSSCTSRTSPCTMRYRPRPLPYPTQRLPSRGVDRPRGSRRKLCRTGDDVAAREADPVEADKTSVGGEPEVAVLILGDREDLAEGEAVAPCPRGDPVVADHRRQVQGDSGSRAAHADNRRQKDEGADSHRAR